MSTVLKIVLLILILQGVTYTWVALACKEKIDEPFHAIFNEIPQRMVNTVDYSQWVHPFKGRVTDRDRHGCVRLTEPFLLDPNDEKSVTYSFLKPSIWHMDFLVSFTFVTLLLTGTDMEYVFPRSTTELYFKIFATHFLYLINLWVVSVVISVTYTKYRDMYKFDYAISDLIKYLRQNGVSEFLQEAVRIYTRLRWKRQKGSWLPEIANQAPLCLREDIMSNLYMHHLITPTLFQPLPHYFLRQLAVRLKRVVIFPGKALVKEGDICPRIYFIHEGEVEKWDTDANGESRMMAVLSINGYFGLSSGLFPNSPYKFTYVTRTVADLVFLEHDDWQDLLDGYPAIKQELYAGTQGMKKEGKRWQSLTSQATSRVFTQTLSSS